jgi:phenylacetate-CoA ligase
MVGADENSIVHVAYGYGLFTGGLGAHYGAERLGATAVPVSSGNTARQIMLLKDFQSDTLCCTPSYAVFLASELKNHGVDVSDLNLKFGVFGAEPWSEEMRQRIEESLHIKAYDIYGLSEIMGPAVAMECTEQNGKHIWEDHFIAEIIDPVTLAPLPEGETGELVITTITKTGMPLIRYRTRDLCSVNRQICKCGRTHTRINRIMGRSDDMLIIRGVNVFPSQIESVLLKHSKGIEPHYQIIVNRFDMLDTVELHVEMSENLFSDEIKEIENLKKELEREINSALGIAVKVKLVEPNSIPRSEGKAKRVVDNRAL